MFGSAPMAAPDSTDARERFAARADDYVESATHAAGADLDLLVSLAALRPGELALDVACGGGHTALALARRGARVTACDLTPKMLDAARGFLEARGVDATYVIAEAGHLPFADGEFAVVTCRIAAHHFPDPAAFFAEAARVLAPGGRLAFQDQALPDDPIGGELIDAFERLRDPSHRHAYPVSGWLHFAEQAGFILEAYSLIPKRHDFAGWCSRQACSDETIAALERFSASLPPSASEWIAPEWHGSKQNAGSQGQRRLAGFANRHLVLLARKPSAANA